MKNIRFSLITGIALVYLLSACTKEFLDIKSPKIAESEYFTSENDVINALTACYTEYSLEDATSYYQYWQGDVLGHDAYKGGEGPGDQQWMEALIQFDYSAAAYTAELQYPYKTYYIGINRCNRFIDVVSTLPTGIISEDKKNVAIAEAKFMRGVYYFELVKMFGSVPKVTHVLNSNEFKMPRATVEDIYGQIDTDFKEAARDLPLKSNQEIGRATKGAAQAYLSKINIYQEKWPEALAWADSVIKSGEYELEESYSDIWLLSNKNGKESIFEIQFTITNNGTWTDENQGSIFTIFTRASNNSGWGFCCPTQEFVDQFEPGDPRLHETVIFNQDTLWKDTPDEEIADNTYPSCIDGYMSKKYQLPLSERGEMSDDPTNWKVIRYAEVLLWRAEAAYYTGGDWQTYLQQVRDRVGMGTSPFIADPLKAIYHEREVEFGMEGNRLWDVIRQGRGEEVLGKYGYQEVSNHYYPIPATEIFSK